MDISLEGSTDPLIEEFLDYEPYLSKTFVHFTFFPFKLAERILETVLGIFVAISPDDFMPLVNKQLKNEYSELGEFKELSAKNIEEGFYDEEKLPESAKLISKERLYFTVRRVEEIAKKLGISQKIKVYSSESENLAFTIGTKLSQTDTPVYISPNLMMMSDEALEFVVGHELSHIAHDDISHQLLFNIGIIAASIFALAVSMPLALPFISAGGFLLSCYQKKSHEINADKESMIVNNTNHGAIEFFSIFNQHLKAQRIATLLTFKKDPSKYFETSCTKTNFLRFLTSFFTKKVAAISISPEGNNRYDYAHPTITSRIEFAKNFKC